MGSGKWQSSCETLLPPSGTCKPKTPAPGADVNRTAENCILWGKTQYILYKTKHSLTIRPTFTCLGIYPNKMKVCQKTKTKKKTAHKSLTAALILNLETTKMSLKTWLDKLWHSNEMLHTHASIQAHTHTLTHTLTQTHLPIYKKMCTTERRQCENDYTLQSHVYDSGKRQNYGERVGTKQKANQWLPRISREWWAKD